MDNYKPTPFIIKISRSFKFLLESAFIFIVSTIIFTSLAIADPFHLPPILFITFWLSGVPFMFSSATTIITALYVFFKTFKKKGPTLHAYNIFSQYILTAAFAGLLFLLVAYSTIRFMNYDPTITDENIIATIAITIFSIINISGFIHLAFLYHKYAKYIDSI